MPVSFSSAVTILAFPYSLTISFAKVLLKNFGIVFTPSFDAFNAISLAGSTPKTLKL